MAFVTWFDFYTSKPHHRYQDYMQMMWFITETDKRDTHCSRQTVQEDKNMASIVGSTTA